MNAVGPNVARVAEISDKLDEIVAMIDTDHGGTVEEPLIVHWTFPFDLPEDFDERFDNVLRQYEREI